MVTCKPCEHSCMHPCMGICSRDPTRRSCAAHYAQIEAFKGLHRPVRELLCEYAGLVVLTEYVELPRGPADNSCLFSVLYGTATTLVGDPADEGLKHIVEHAGVEGDASGGWQLAYAVYR